MGFVIFFEQDLGVIAAIEFEQGMIGAGILDNFVSKLSYSWQQSCPIILLSINKYSKVRFYLIMYCNNVTIRLPSRRMLVVF